MVYSNRRPHYPKKLLNKYWKSQTDLVTSRAIKVWHKSNNWRVSMRFTSEDCQETGVSAPTPAARPLPSSARCVSSRPRPRLFTPTTDASVPRGGRRGGVSTAIDFLNVSSFAASACGRKKKKKRHHFSRAAGCGATGWRTDRIADVTWRRTGQLELFIKPVMKIWYFASNSVLFGTSHADMLSIEKIYQAETDCKTPMLY